MEDKFVGLEGKRALLVDDDPTIRSIINYYLTKFGMSITECNDGNEALSALQSLTPDLVITDLHMPACDGKNLLIGIRKLGFKFPIIVLSGTCRESDRKDFINAGFADCLQKGSTPTTLFKSIQDALSVK